MPFRASRSRASSSGSVSAGASRKSVSRPKCRWSSRLARNRTSSASTRPSMSSALVSIVGTTTSVRDCGGSPCEKSMRGSGRGVTSNVASQFTIPTASWLVASSRRMPSVTSTRVGNPVAMRLRQQRRGERRRDRRDRAEVQQQRNPPPDPAERLGERTGASPPLARAAADPCRSDRSRRGRRDRRRRSCRRCRRCPRAPAGSPCAPRRFRTDGCPSRSPRRRAGSGRGSRNPSCRRARPDPRAASCSTTLIVSTNSRQSIDPRKRRLPIVLLIETWSPACSCVSDCTSCSIDEARLGQPLLDPGERQRQRGALSLQPARQLGDERAHHRRVRARHVRDHQDQALGIVLGDVHHLVRPRRRPGCGRSCRPRSGRRRGADSRSAPGAA